MLVVGLVLKAKLGLSDIVLNGWSMKTFVGNTHPEVGKEGK